MGIVSDDVIHKRNSATAVWTYLGLPLSSELLELHCFKNNCLCYYCCWSCRPSNWYFADFSIVCRV